MAVIPKNFNIPPPETEYCLLTFPVSHVLLVTINRPQKLNALHLPAHFELDGIFNWYKNITSTQMYIYFLLQLD